MTPFEIDILLHYHTRPGDHEACINQAPIWRETINRLIDDGLVSIVVCSKSNSFASYELTERGRFYVEHGLCAVPLPESQWFIPSGGRSVMTRPHAANVECCGTPVGVVEIPGLYDGGAYWQCVICGTTYRRWPADHPIGARVDMWAATHGVTLQECPS